MTEEKRKRYDDALALLKRISEGKATLGIVEDPTPSATSIQVQSEGRLFTRTKLAGVL